MRNAQLPISGRKKSAGLRSMLFSMVLKVPSIIISKKVRRVNRPSGISALLILLILGCTLSTSPIRSNPTKANATTNCMLISASLTYDVPMVS